MDQQRKQAARLPRRSLPPGFRIGMNQSQVVEGNSKQPGFHRVRSFELPPSWGKAVSNLAQKFPTSNSSWSLSTTKSTPLPQDDQIFQESLKHLQYTQRDVHSVLIDDKAFKALQKALRQRGCVTNTYLKENFHLYVRHMKDVDQLRQRHVKEEECQQHAPGNAAA